MTAVPSPDRADSSDSLTRQQLFFYALPALPLALLFLPLYVTLPTYYGEDLGLGLATVGLVLFFARIWDVITDPLIGAICDRGGFFGITSLGKRRSWMVAGVPVILLAATFLFLPQSLGQSASWLGLLLGSMLLYLGTTMVMLPYAAWGAELSRDYQGRSRITAWREALAIIGTLLAVGVPAALLLDRSGSVASSAILLWCLLPLTVLLAVTRVPETPARVRAQSRVGVRRGLAIMKQNGPFLRLILSYFLNGVANGLPATLFLLFVEFRLESPELAGPLLFLYLAMGVLGIPFWLWLSARWGKDRVWIGAMIWASLVFATVPLLGPGDEVWFIAICFLTGLSLGADLALPPSMQADVIDLDRLKSGQQRSGIYFAVWGVATKLALALAVGLAFPLLELAGFDGGAAANTTFALFALAALYSLLPAAFKLAAVACLRGYRLDAATQQRIQGLIARREARPWTPAREALP